MNNMKRTQLAIQIDILFAFHLMTDDSSQTAEKGPQKMGGGQENPDPDPDPKPENLNLNNEVIGRICLGQTTKVVGMRRL